MVATALPAAGYFNNPARTNQEAKDAQDAQLAFIRQSLLGASAIGAYTLASDAFTPLGTEAIFVADTQGAAATDSLSTIAVTNTTDGQLVMVTQANSGRVITVTHGIGGSGQILLRGARNMVLDTETYLILQRRGTNWVEVGRTPTTDYDFYCGTAGGTANALTLTATNQVPAVYFTGMRIHWIAAADNTSGTVALTLNGLSSKNLKKRMLASAATLLAIPEMRAGLPYSAVYDGTQFVLASSVEIGRNENSIASASTLDLSATTGDMVNVTGTTTITAVTLNDGQASTCYLGGALQITHGASLVCPGGANLVLPAGTLVRFRRLSSVVYIESLQSYFDQSKIARIDQNQTWTKAQRGAYTSLTSSTSITPDFSLGNNFTLTLAHNTTLNAPSNMSAGQSGIIEIIQDGTGGRTMAFASNWYFAGGVDPVLSTGANTYDILSYCVTSGGSIMWCGFMKGLA